MNSKEQTDFDEAALRQWAWKTPAMKAMTLAVCRLALERAGSEFSANDLPEFIGGKTASVHGGQGVAGAIFHRLIADGILARVGRFECASRTGQPTFYPKVVLNAGGNKVGVYRLACSARARTLLRVHGQPEPELKQVEMAMGK